MKSNQILAGSSHRSSEMLVSLCSSQSCFTHQVHFTADLTGKARKARTFTNWRRKKRATNDNEVRQMSASCVGQKVDQIILFSASMKEIGESHLFCQNRLYLRGRLVIELPIHLEVLYPCEIPLHVNSNQWFKMNYRNTQQLGIAEKQEHNETPTQFLRDHARSRRKMEETGFWRSRYKLESPFLLKLRGKVADARKLFWL